MPLPANTSSGRALLTRPTNLLAQIRALALGLSASARWWLGDEATLTAWVDRIGGVSAAAGGSGLAFGALGGRGPSHSAARATTHRQHSRRARSHSRTR